MGCDSLNQQTNLLSVSLGALPEGFCPATMQELGQAIAERLIISPATSASSFAIGPIAPTSNVGPWLKNCEDWFVWNDTTASYRPITKGGFDTLVVIESSQDFIVPVDIYKIMAHAWGGGGGGFNNGTEAAGGGSGAYGMIIRDVLPGQTIPCVVGSGGSIGAPGTNGGDTTILGMTAGGGGAGGVTEATTPGVYSGADLGINGGASYRASGGNEPGQGGDAPRGGGGGTWNQVSATFAAGHIPGGGGCGSTSFQPAGAGARGQIEIWY